MRISAIDYDKCIQVVLLIIAIFSLVVALPTQTSTATNNLYKAIFLANNFSSVYIVKENQNHFAHTWQ